MALLYRNDVPIFRNDKPLFGDECCCGGCDVCISAKPPCCSASEIFVVQGLNCTEDLLQGQVEILWSLAAFLRVTIKVSFLPPPAARSNANGGDYIFIGAAPYNCDGPFSIPIVLADTGVCDWTNATVTALQHGDGYLITIMGVTTPGYLEPCNCNNVNGSYLVECPPE